MAGKRASLCGLKYHVNHLVSQRSGCSRGWGTMFESVFEKTSRLRKRHRHNRGYVFRAEVVHSELKMHACVSALDNFDVATTMRVGAIVLSMNTQGRILFFATGSPPRLFHMRFSRSYLLNKSSYSTAELRAGVGVHTDDCECKRLLWFP